MTSTSNLLDAFKRRVLEETLIVERVDPSGEPVTQRGLKWGTPRASQLVERGIAPTWSMSREECQGYWASRVPRSLTS